MRTISALLFSIFLSSIATDTKASFIVNGNVGIESISINETFESFYDRGGSTQYSSNTGFEQTDSIVFFFAEYLGNYALLGLVDSNVSFGDDTDGNLDLGLADLSSTSGSLLFVDDPIEDVTFNTNGFDAKFRWTNDYNDGFIYQLGDETSVEIDIVLGNIAGLSNIQFVDFSNNTASVLNLGSPSSTDVINIRTADNVTGNSNLVEVNTPSTLLIFALSLIGICAFRRK